MIYFLLTLLVIVLDQASKWLIVHNLNLYDEVPVIGDFFVITSHRNRGAAFSILQDQRIFFILITTVAVSGIVYYMTRTMRQKRSLLTCGLGVLLGGALGNFIDRLRLGEVVDFLQFTFRFTLFGFKVDYTFAIFNIADAAITIGVILILLDTFLDWRKERKNQTHVSELPGTEKVD
ncbi:signal peptidase II [Gorillibacterium timonense]|uniref:signal peptidase II n=1 Tax=Gorillibacterium timonense TaxID=1689269 RepID=UPI00071D674A|nr:signal peptidase II [Gorillibacterium timonense]